MTSLDIIPREDWSRIKPRRIELTTPKRKFAHHTVGGAGVPDRNDDGDSGDDYLRIVEHVHINVNGWDDVAYNFFIDPVGLEIYEGQGWGREPNAQKGFNRGTWAVAIIGDFRKRHPDHYPGLLERIAELVRYGQQIGELPAVPLEGHRDAPGLSSYICPGPNLYAALPAINRLVEEEPMTELQARLEIAVEWHARTGKWMTGASGEDPQERLTRLAKEVASGKRTVADIVKYAGSPKRGRRNEPVPSWVLNPYVPYGRLSTSSGGLSEDDVKAIVNNADIVVR